MASNFYYQTLDGNINVKFYYRDKNKELHAVAVTDAEDFKTARQSALEFLSVEGESFLLPLLGLIKGGKA